MTEFDIRAALVLAALAIDAVWGEPSWLWSRLSHPIAFMGRFVGLLDRSLNRDSAGTFARYLLGITALFVLLGTVAGLAWLVQTGLSNIPFGWIAEAICVAILIAQRSLYDHVRAVVSALQTGNLDAARTAVSKIVGRDPQTLNQSDVARASIESTAENFSDGIAAPVFWYLVGGLVGIAAYKALNTADSMIGHRNARYRQFGWAAARLDDVANFIPARLSAIMILAGAAILGEDWRRVWRTIWRDASHHASINAGWPEAAFAGALNISLAGPRTYGGTVSSDPWINQPGRRDIGASDIGGALGLLIAACVVQFIVVVLFAATVFAIS